MSLRIGLASLLALAVATTPAIAATPTTAADQAAASADENKIVCKREARVNSRFKDSVCKTRAQWEEMRIQQRRDAKEWLDRPMIDTRRGG